MNVNYLYVGLSLVIQVVLLVSTFWKSYNSKKGENLATIEDISKITTIVESIKQDLNEKAEEIKLKLSFENEHRLTMRSLEREAIMNFYNSLWAHVSILMALDTTVYDLQTFSDIRGEERIINDSRYKMQIAEAQFNFYSDNHEIFNIIGTIHQAIITIESAIRMQIINVIQIYSVAQIKKDSKVHENYYSEMSKEIRDGLVEFSDKRLNSYKEILINNNKLKVLLKNRLNELIK